MLMVANKFAAEHDALRVQNNQLGEENAALRE